MKRMKQRTRSITMIILLLLAMATPESVLAQKQHAATISSKDITDEALVKQLPGFKNGYATVNGVKIHYVTGGTGKPLVLLSGWPQTWWSFHKMMPSLQQHYTVIAVDYRGMGSSGKPAGGYDKKTVAGDVAALLQTLGYKQVYVAGHDIGAQVAFSLAANYPGLVEKLVVIDVPHPDETFAAMPMLPAPGTPIDKLDPAHPYVWWFAFNQLHDLPEALLAGRMAVFQQTVFHYLLQEDSSMPAFDRAVYANAYNTAEAIRAGNAWYQAFMQDISDYKTYDTLRMPVLGLGGPGYEWLKYTLPNKTADLQVVKVEHSGHFVPEEQPGVAVEAIERFLQ